MQTFEMFLITIVSPVVKQWPYRLWEEICKVRVRLGVRVRVRVGER